MISTTSVNRFQFAELDCKMVFRSPKGDFQILCLLSGLYSCQQHLQIRCPLCRMRVPTASWAPFVDQSVYLKAELMRLFET